MSNISFDFLEFYETAKQFSLKNPDWEKDIEWQNNVRFEDLDVWLFYKSYVWVVLHSNWGNTQTRNLFNKWKKEINNFSVIKNKRKRFAVEQGFEFAHVWLKQLRECSSPEQMIEYLDTLPMIGETLKYHLAKNFGLQVAKPDVHLLRAAKHFGFEENFDGVQSLCRIISEKTGDKIPVVDLIIWRFLRENPQYRKEWNCE